jgi:peptide/nickel transport system substrate-binding protein
MKRIIHQSALLTITLVLLLSAPLLLLSGCKQEPRVLNFALSGNPDTLDPHKTSGTLTFQTLKSVYDTLVEPDPQGKIIPALAESWEVSPDALIWTFHLRPGVRFHNGDELTAGDVKATFERIRSEAVASPNAGEFAAIAAMETPDEATIVLRLSKPYAPLLATLASGWGAILPAGLIAAGHDFGSLPVGTGPYRLSEWVRDSKIVLTRNEDYWMAGLPKLDTVVMNIITERAVQVQGLLTGELDVSYLIDKEDLPVLEENPDVRVERSLTALILVMAMNCSDPLLSDLRIRQAINHAVDKQTVLDVAYGGGQVIGTFMDSGNAYYKDFSGLYTYDPGRAKALLAEAGAEGAELLMVLPQNYEPHVKAGELYQEMLTRVGLDVRIKLVDWSTWISDVYRGGKYQLTVIGHTGKLDPDGTLAGYGTESRYVRWVNPEAAELIGRARETGDFEARRLLYDRALEIMAREVPFLYLGSSFRYVGLRERVKDFRMTPMLDTFDFRWTELD